MTLCKNCGKETSNPKFCSRSCSAKVANKIPKKKRTRSPYYCAACGVPIVYGRKYCPKSPCQPHYVDWSAETLGELREKRKYQIHSRVRQLSRRRYLKSGRPKECVECGYYKHFEVCHIVDIWSMPNNTTVEEACSVDNLIALCPNHHWELDHGLLPHIKAFQKMKYSL